MYVLYFHKNNVPWRTYVEIEKLGPFVESEYFYINKICSVYAVHWNIFPLFFCLGAFYICTVEFMFHSHSVSVMSVSILKIVHILSD
jgi:hypothetical protein